MKKSYLFIIDKIEGGGAERQLLNVARYISNGSDNTEIFISSLHAPNKDMLNRISDLGFTFLPIHGSSCGGKLKWLFSLFSLCARIRKIYQEKSIHKCVTFLEWSNILSSLALFGKPVTLNVRNHLSSQYRNKHFLALYLFKFIIRFTYNYSEWVICNSHGIKQDLIENFGVKEGKILVITNTYNVNNIQSYCRSSKVSDNGIVRFVTCGRLTKQKRFDSLIASFNYFSAMTGRQDLLTIVGSGEDEQYLKGLVKLNKSNIRFIPHTSGIYNVLAESDCFILHSDFEGFPNVLAESVILGLDCISTDCLTGPREILSGNNFTNYSEVINDVLILKYGILYPYTNISGAEMDFNLVSALEKYSFNRFSFEKSNYVSFDERKGEKEWQRVL